MYLVNTCYIDITIVGIRVVSTPSLDGYTRWRSKVKYSTGNTVKR